MITIDQLLTYPDKAPMVYTDKSESRIRLGRLQKTNNIFYFCADKEVYDKLTTWKISSHSRYEFLSEEEYMLKKLEL